MTAHRYLLLFGLCLLAGGCNRGGRDEPAADDLAPPADAAGPGDGAAPADLASPAGCTSDARELLLLKERGQISLPRLAWAGDRYGLVWYDDSVGGPGSGKLAAYFAFVSADGKLDAASLRPLPMAGAAGAFPRAAFSGAEFGVAYTGGPGRQARFLRVSAAGEVVPGSDLGLGAMEDGLALAWNPDLREWAVAWAALVTTGMNPSYRISLARISAAGAPLGTTTVDEGPGIADLAPHGNSPLLWTGTRYAIAFRPGNGGPTQVAELSGAGQVLRRIPLGGGSAPFRVALAWDGAGYGVAWMDAASKPTASHFARIDRDGKFLPATDRVLGTAGFYQGEPAIIWDGQSYVIVWAEASTEPMKVESALWGVRLGAGGEVLEPARRLTESYAWWPALTWNGCQYAIPYVRSTRSEEARLVLLPGSKPLGALSPPER